MEKINQEKFCDCSLALLRESFLEEDIRYIDLDFKTVGFFMRHPTRKETRVLINYCPICGAAIREPQG